MRTHYIILLVSLIPLFTNAQGTKLLDYRPNSFGGLTVKPLIESPKSGLKGIQGQGYWTDFLYVDSVITNTIKKVIPSEILKQINPSTAYFLYFNSEGEVISCYFTINPNDTILIPEVELYKLYTLFMATKFDTAKVKVVHPHTLREDKEYSYAFMGGSIVPVKLRKR